MTTKTLLLSLSGIYLIGLGAAYLRGGWLAVGLSLAAIPVALLAVNGVAWLTGEYRN